MLQSTSGIFEQNIETEGAGFQAQSNSEMRLTSPRGTNHYDILPVLNKLAINANLKVSQKG